MPCSTEKEKAFINDELLAEDEKLFFLHGLKKVTVNDLAVVANISKGSFYAFCPSRGRLYIEINSRLQQKLFESIETVVKKKHYPTQKALTKGVIMMSFIGIIASPILSQIDLSIMDYLQRKSSPDTFSNHVYDDIRILEMLQQVGVQLTIPHTVLIEFLYSVLTCLGQFREDEELEQMQTLLVDDIVEQVVKKQQHLFGYLTDRQPNIFLIFTRLYFTNHRIFKKEEMKMIEVNKLCFSYTNKPFAENVSFHVRRGEIFGLLGSSGADKSTIQKVLTGLDTGYKGNVRVAGTEVRERTNRFHERIGVNFEFSACYEKFTTRESLKYFDSLYNRPLHSIEELLRMMGLENGDDRKVSDSLKSIRSRLGSIRVSVHDPNILFLDEPTSGLDPTNDRSMKDIILAERKRGKTITITTHNMFDATELCDWVAFIVSGEVGTLDILHSLIMSRGAAEIRYAYSENGEKTGEYMPIQTSDDKWLNKLIRSNSLHSVHSSEPALSDIFVNITGRVLQ